MSTYKWSVPSGDIINGSTLIKDTDNKIQSTVNDLVDFVNAEGIHANQGLTFDMLDKQSPQVVTGVKTFQNGIISNVTGDLTGNVTGNADSATKLETPRKINGVDFDGSVDINTFQTGMIMLWSGSSASIPATWYLCNGSNGTPNLMDRFVVGAGSTYAVGATGGSADAIVVAHTHTTPNHSHTASSNTTGAHTHSFTYTAPDNDNVGRWSLAGDAARNDTANTASNGSHSHIITVNSGGAGTTGSTGSSGTNANLPPYYALCYIMKG
jgi:hypothetical protein